MSASWWRERPALSRLGLTGVVTATAVLSTTAAVALSGQLLPHPGSCDTQRLAASVLPAVVTVFAAGPSGSGSGSGAVVRPDGVVVTNDHVIATAGTTGTLEVLLNNGEQLPATLVGTDPLTDLAVVRIDRDRLPTLPISPGEVLQVGQPVVALGAPLGLSGTVTSGIISGLNRSVPVPKAGGGTTVLVGSIQTDAAINPGNSGGPLVTCDGRLIGVNTAISTVPNSAGVAGGGSVGIGFAVPATTAQRVTDEILANGRASHPWLGFTATEIPAEVAKAFGTPSGLFIQQVSAGGPAADGGLKPGDLITGLAGVPATSTTQSALLLTAKVGDTVAVTYQRRGASAETTLTLAEQP
ncbi:trypsin-like peptidase domain-containing protein [Micropruina sp.]|jgi:putative serine protease PepD|uniref:S1C family serine protease n=1 Tax=Micropruina sp. TaxID=2737536 RepID=UPI002637D6AD|nr:trypsin-like peptidase domain-containing protein [Micropruina sp.]